jgi:hypothetical protein
VLPTSGTLLRLALLRSRALRAARTAIAGVAVRIGPLANRMTRTVSGIAVAYPAPPGAHRLAGGRAPDVRLAAGDRGPGRLYQALRGGRFVLVAPPGDHAAADHWAGRVDLAVPAGATGIATLVRPDGYVAWAGDETDPERRAEALRQALTAWCGAPVRSLGPAAG